MKNKIILGLLLSLFIISAKAQQDPHYTQYMYNMNVINPAYAGSKENLSVGLLYRRQWVGIEGAPKSATMSIHSPVGKNVGLGLSFISDKIGPVEENNVYGDFSYTLNLGGSNRLAFGLKSGLTFHNVGLFSDIGNGFVPQPNDLAFRENSNNIYFNIGTGIFYYTNKYYFAASIPNMLEAKHLVLKENGNVYQFGSEKRHAFVTGGYVFQLDENVKFKPSFMAKYALNTPISIDISANTLFFDKLEAGISYRLEDSFGAIVNFAVTPNIKIGYAYDYITSNLKVTTSATHEFILLFDINKMKKVSVSPRFF